MKTIETTLTTTAIFSDDGTKKYLIHKCWDSEKPSLAIVLLFPSTCSGIVLDNTTQLCINNVDRLGYGSVSIVNLFATLDDADFTSAEKEDKENMKIILEEAKKCDTLVYAPGIGKAKNPAFQVRSEQVLSHLKPYEKKMMCITNEERTIRLRHPLTPALRTWYLSPVTVTEIRKTIEEASQPPKPIGRPRKS